MKEINNHIEEIQKLCLQHHVKALYAFGSVLQDRLNQSSDIDMIVEFQPLELKSYANNYYNLKFSLQQILDRPVDLLENQAIKNPYFRKEIEKKKQPVYVA
jgi:predicted nucleotidyltransferase